MPRILVVDDEEPMRTAQADYLRVKNRIHNWEVLEASNPSEALGVIRDGLASQPIDVLVTDLMMGTDIDAGLNLLVAAQAIDPSLMTILYTAKSASEVQVPRQNAFDKGAFDVI